MLLWPYRPAQRLKYCLGVSTLGPVMLLPSGDFLAKGAVNLELRHDIVALFLFFRQISLRFVV